MYLRFYPLCWLVYGIILPLGTFQRQAILQNLVVKNYITFLYILLNWKKEEIFPVCNRHKLLTFSKSNDNICNTFATYLRQKKGALMNIDNLHTIFANYIRKFDVINEPTGHDENYKWRLASQFPALMNPDSPDFIAGMKKVAGKKLSYNLINSNHHYPLTALIKCAETEETAVRDLFRALFADDGGSMIMRQKKIDTFIAGANALTAKAHPEYKDIGQLKNDQRSAMSYLFFNDPEHHYLYKYTEVAEFAKAVEFSDDMGYGSGFKMDVFYRMCDELVAEIRNCDLLLKTTRRRYYNSAGEKLDGIYEDKNYHILAFDIIWGTGITTHADYNFGEGIPWLS